MKTIRTMIAVGVTGMACSVITSQASLTYVNETGANGEPTLNTIMTTVYGANYTRVDDSIDQIWNLISPTGTASLDAIYAGNSQALYTTDLLGNQKAGPIISVNGGGYINPGSATGTIAPTVNPFLFMDNSPNTSATYWSSDPSLNSDDYDHMVTFEITGGTHAGDYVIAFEDLPYGISDLDYNDFVVQVSGVAPVPEATTTIAGALLLLPLGASTLRILRRQRS
jgi:hypothetical protein